MEGCNLLFVGDIVIKKDLESFLSKEIENIVKKHDVVSCNFEGPLLTPNSNPILKVGPNICQHPRASEILMKSGFNLINLANNHIFDYGKEALNHTLKNFSKIDVVGAGNSSIEAYKLKIITRKGIKIGFFSFAEWGFGVTTNKDKLGFAWINHISVNQKIKSAKKVVDILIIQVHAGVEEVNLPLPEWKRRYQQLIELGADLVIGHHPHIAQGWEIYKKRYIFYSLGNFYFEGDKKNTDWNRGYMVSVNINKKKIINSKVIPIRKEKDVVELYNNPDFNEHLVKLCNDISDKRYMKKINLQSLKLWRERYNRYFKSPKIKERIKNFLKPFFGRKKTSRELILFHFFKIESHYFTIKRALEFLSKKENEQT